MHQTRRGSPVAPPEQAGTANWVKPPRWKSQHFWEAATGYLFIAPAIVYFLVFQLTGIVWAFYLSFTKYNLRTAPQWVGLQTYVDLFTDRLRFPYFWHSIWISLKWVVLEQPGVIILPLLVALLLNTEVKGEGIFKTLFFIPVITPGVALAVAWRWILDPNTGLLNQVLGTKISWLKDANWALPSLAIMSIWGAIGFSVFLWLSALKSIPNEVYEAAAIDGATGLRRAWHITIPLLRPTLFYTVVTGSIGAFQAFGPMYLLTNGDPENSTLTYALLLYRHLTRYDEVGTALAMAFILLVLILVVTWLNFKFIPQKVD